MYYKYANVNRQIYHFSFAKMKEIVCEFRAFGWRYLRFIYTYDAVLHSANDAITAIAVIELALIIGAATKLWLYANFHGSYTLVKLIFIFVFVVGPGAQNYKFPTSFVYVSNGFDYREEEKKNSIKFRIVGRVKCRSNDFKTILYTTASIKHHVITANENHKHYHYCGCGICCAFEILRANISNYKVMRPF